ncbi:MAG: hypothetical protein K2W95_06210 [Candidatus Obscuribacterales bacterium]|nr:hypothetical protein [Candidatus Obscuribacterales bacterium]
MVASYSVAELPNVSGEWRPLILTIADRVRLRSTQEIVSFAAVQQPAPTVKLAEKAIRKDALGRITAFRYADRIGIATKFFTEISYDAENKVVSFLDARGYRWTKLRTKVHKNAGWSCTDASGRCQTRKAVHLGEVYFTEHGLQAAGKDSGFLGVPSNPLRN